MTENDEANKNYLTLKWGTLKGWHLNTPAAIAALQKYMDAGDVSMSAMMRHDTPEQKQALLDAIDHMDEILLDWENKVVSRQEAKDYILNYGKEPKPVHA